LFEVLLVLVVLAAVVLIVSGPLRRARPEPAERRDEVAELEAARDAKYREIRDAELDHATGKLSEDDYQAIDTTLRAEAITILHDLDRAREARDGEAAAESE
jgi:Na+-transporting methylmalonyl-CoA/oxaloacetate decarboxylase gamma subunit